MSPEFSISPGSTVPLYRQLFDQVRKATAMGNLKEGDQLPSVRSLAERLVINPNTVAKAYSELLREGIVESKAGKGLFVARKRTIYSHEENQRRLEQALSVFMSEISSLDLDAALIRKAVIQQLDDLLKAKKMTPGGSHD